MSYLQNTRPVSAKLAWFLAWISRGSQLTLIPNAQWAEVNMKRQVVKGSIGVLSAVPAPAALKLATEVMERPLNWQDIEFIWHPDFDDPKKRAEILAVPLPEIEGPPASRKKAKNGSGKDEEEEAFFTRICDPDPLPMPVMRPLFKKMNFLKCRAVRRLQKYQDGARRKPLPRTCKEAVEKDLAEALAIRNVLVLSNTRLVLNWAKRQQGHGEASWTLEDWFAAGLLTLVKVADKYDFGRANVLSTYLSWSLIRNFQRDRTTGEERNRRCRNGVDDAVFELMMSPDGEEESEVVERQQEAAAKLERLFELAGLDPRERQIIRLRSGIGVRGGEGMKLDDVGAELGITKERVRQLQVRIMNKLRAAAHEHPELEGMAQLMTAA